MRRPPPFRAHCRRSWSSVPLLPRGANYLAIEPGQGGYDGYAPGFLPPFSAIPSVPLIAAGPGGTVLVESALEEIRRERPNAVMLGQSFFLFPYPLREIAEAAHSVDALVLYDGSHVLGLIAGGEFQDPLREGADVLFGGTHKSFPGPQGGLVLTDRDDLFREIDAALVWRVLDNAHWNRIAGVAQTLLELERFGAEYARTAVENAQALARALDERGVPLVAKDQGFSRSHQVHVDREALYAKYGVGPSVMARRLERQGILLDLIGRLGTAEVARLGLRPTDMHRMAEPMDRGGLQRERVGPEVRAWRRQFPTLRFQ